MNLRSLHRVVTSQEFAAGLIFMTIGVVGFLASQAHQMGSAARMGPGYLPRVLCVSLLAIGIAMMAKAGSSEAKALERIPLRGVVLIAAGLLSFAGLMEVAGLVFALPCLVVVAAAAGREFRAVEVALLAVVLTAACALLFVHFLSLPLPVLRGG